MPGLITAKEPLASLGFSPWTSATPGNRGKKESHCFRGGDSAFGCDQHRAGMIAGEWGKGKMKTMREFVQKCEDSRILAAFDLIEGYLPNRIQARRKTGDIARLGTIGKCHEFIYDPMQIGWIIQNDIPLLRAIIFHEMIHIAMYLEGWQKIYSDFYFKNGDDTRLSASYLADLLPNIEVWKRNAACGFGEAESLRWDRSIKMRIVDKFHKLIKIQPQRNNHPINCNGDLSHNGAETLLDSACILIATGFLSPASHRAKRQLEKFLQIRSSKACAKPFEIVDFLSNQQLTPKNLPSVLAGVLRLLSLHHELLELEESEVDAPGLWTQIQEIFLKP